ncbi:MAG: hypothetical protein LAO04_19020 [Acidobacteriia bacterium]|nr:hypothetical protein [Terriglobia bacterium]
MTRRISYMLVVILLISSALATAVEFLHPKLKGKEISIRNVVVLPPIVKMTKQGVKGAEGMAKEEEEAAGTIASGVTAGLTGSGLSVESPFTEEALRDNNELKYAVADVQRKFDEIAPQLYKKPKDIRKGRFSLGDMVAVLNSKGTADALVIIRSDGQKQTKGKAFMTGGLVGMATSGKATFISRVALVDAKNGDILYLANYITSGIPNNKAFDKSFRSLSAPK